MVWVGRRKKKHNSAADTSNSSWSLLSPSLSLRLSPLLSPLCNSRWSQIESETFGCINFLWQNFVRLPPCKELFFTLLTFPAVFFSSLCFSPCRRRPFGWGCLAYEAVDTLNLQRWKDRRVCKICWCKILNCCVLFQVLGWCSEFLLTNLKFRWVRFPTFLFTCGIFGFELERTAPLLCPFLSCWGKLVVLLASIFMFLFCVYQSRKVKYKSQRSWRNVKKSVIDSY